MSACSCFATSGPSSPRWSDTGRYAWLPWSHRQGTGERVSQPGLQERSGPSVTLGFLLFGLPLNETLTPGQLPRPLPLPYLHALLPTVPTVRKLQGTSPRPQALHLHWRDLFLLAHFAQAGCSSSNVACIFPVESPSCSGAGGALWMGGFAPPSLGLLGWQYVTKS